MIPFATFFKPPSPRSRKTRLFASGTTENFSWQRDDRTIHSRASSDRTLKFQGNGDSIGIDSGIASGEFVRNPSGITSTSLALVNDATHPSHRAVKNQLDEIGKAACKREANPLKTTPLERAISSAGRAPRLHRGCREFESLIAHHSRSGDFPKIETGQRWRTSASIAPSVAFDG